MGWVDGWVDGWMGGWVDGMDGYALQPTVLVSGRSHIHNRALLYS